MAHFQYQANARAMLADYPSLAALEITNRTERTQSDIISIEMMVPPDYYAQNCSQAAMLDTYPAVAVAEVTNRWENPQFDIFLRELLAPPDYYHFVPSPTVVSVIPPTPLPSSSRGAPLIDRIPEEIDNRLRRVIDQIRNILNSVIRDGYLVNKGPGDWTMAAGPYNATRNPNADDDFSDGYIPGTIWINTDTNGIFICVDSTVGAAIWTGPIT